MIHVNSAFSTRVRRARSVLAWREIAMWTVAVVCIGYLATLLVHPGVLLSRDMVVLDTPALSRDALGVGDLPARNAPQDGLLAFVGQILPASWFARLLILATTAVGAWTARSFGPAGVALTLCNPFVVERLAQGQWSLVMAAWLLPGIVATRHTPARQLALMWIASITPTGAVVAAVVALVSRPRWVTLASAVLVSLPWLIPSLLTPPHAPATSAFYTRAETDLGVGASVLSLGGIWNGEVARTAGVLAGLALVALLVSRLHCVPRRLIVLATLGLLGAWLSVDLQALPGGGLFRDTHKLVMFAIPCYVALAGALQGVWTELACIILVALSCVQAPAQLAELRPVPADPAWEQLAHEADGLDVLLAHTPTAITRVYGRTVVDPRTKVASVIQPGALIVSGDVADPPHPRWVAAQRAWAHNDEARLRELGVGLVVDGTRIHRIDGVAPQPRAAGLALLSVWLAYPLGLGLAVQVRRRRSHRS